MASPPTSTARRRRMTQAERREATRTALLEATLESLVEHGYAGTTTARVAEIAGLSRGAQLNYFPSKAALVSAAVTHLADRRMAELASRSAAIPAGPGQVAALLDVLWDAHQGEIFDATLELWVAARTDPELRDHLVELERRVTASAMRIAVDVLGAGAGRQGFRDDLELALATVRGLALLRISSGAGSRAVNRRWAAARERLLRLMG